MKIYVSLPLNFDEKELKSFLEGVAHLKKLGHNVLEHTSGKVENKDHAARLFTNSEKAIKDTDIVIAEVSNSDSKVGFEIARAFNEKKFVIALENVEKAEKVNPIIHGNKTKSLIHKKYSSTDIIAVIESSLKEAASKLDSKFILIISPEIDRYLDWASQTKRMHKAQIVRNALEQTMKKDREYRTYLQG